MRNLLGALSFAFALVVAACGDPEPGPDYPSPEPGQMPGQQVGAGGMDLDALAAESELEEEPADESSEAQDQAGEADAEGDADEGDADEGDAADE